MAPEVSVGKPYGKPADMFSFGVICYQMITLNMGITHYLQATMKKEQYYSDIKADIIKVDKLYSSLGDLVCKLLQMDPNERPTPTEFIQQVKQIEKSIQDIIITQQKN